MLKENVLNSYDVFPKLAWVALIMLKWSGATVLTLMGNRLSKHYKIGRSIFYNGNNDDFELTHQCKACFRLWHCRNPGHRRLLLCIAICWVLVVYWSWAGELRAQRLSKGDAKPNGEPRLRPAGCMQRFDLRDLPRGIVAAFAEHNGIQGIPQQCTMCW